MRDPKRGGGTAVPPERNGVSLRLPREGLAPFGGRARRPRGWYTRRVDALRTLLAPLLALVGVAAYFIVTTRLGVYQRVPWQSLALLGAAAVLGAVRLARAPGLGSGLAAAFSVAVLGLSLWYLFAYSMYGPREQRPGVGDRFPDFTLADSTGAQFQLGALRGRRVLLLFYRGDW